MEKRKTAVNLTEGPIIKSILLFAIPLFMGQLLQQLYHTADAWVIGNFADNDAFAAVSSAGSMTHLIVGLFNGIAIGGGVIIVPGVKIGYNSVIGAGSVVTKDIPSNVVAVGNPCKVLREINEHDKIYYYKNEKIHRD